jgi:FSR family fosmidomycin resistance protein-like MFS transporter
MTTTQALTSTLPSVEKTHPTWVTPWLAMAHFSNDFFTGSLGLILVAQSERLDLSNTQFGLASSGYLGISLLQPLLGWLTDRIERAYLMLGGAFISALGVLIIALAPSYSIILFGSVVAGIGNAMFHPIGLASARAFAKENASGRSVALFMLGGNGAFAIGPLIIGWVLDTVGLRGVAPFVLLSAIFVPVILLRLRPVLRGSLTGAQKTTQIIRVKDADGNLPQINWWQNAIFILVIYMIVVFLRGTMHQSLGTFLPKYYTEQDRSLVFAGIATFALLFAAAFGSYFGAVLSDYVPRRLIITFSLTAMTPLMLLLLEVSGVWIFVFSIALGLLVNANWPLLLMIGQEVAPGGAVSASGFAFGWGFFASAAGSFFIGVLADEIGLGPALRVMSVMPLLAVSMIYLLPQPAPKN